MPGTDHDTAMNLLTSALPPATSDQASGCGLHGRHGERSPRCGTPATSRRSPAHWSDASRAAVRDPIHAPGTKDSGDVQLPRYCPLAGALLVHGAMVGQALQRLAETTQAVPTVR
jgi:hypothetical protein